MIAYRTLIGAFGLVALTGCTTVAGWMGYEPKPAAVVVAPAPVTPAAAAVRDSTWSPDQIKAVQSKLGVRADGVWGPASSAALSNYQRDHNLSATGKLDGETMDALGMNTPVDGSK